MPNPRAYVYIGRNVDTEKARVSGEQVSRKVPWKVKGLFKVLSTGTGHNTVLIKNNGRKERFKLGYVVVGASKLPADTQSDEVVIRRIVGRTQGTAEDHQCKVR